MAFRPELITKINIVISLLVGTMFLCYSAIKNITEKSTINFQWLYSEFILKFVR